MCTVDAWTITYFFKFVMDVCMIFFEVLNYTCIEYAGIFSTFKLTLLVLDITINSIGCETWYKDISRKFSFCEVTCYVVVGLNIAEY